MKGSNDNTEQISKWIEWEIMNKKNLHNKKLEKKEYPMNIEHAHCELCWAKFGNYPEALKQGFFESESQSWICEDCYSIFRNFFNWTIS